MLAQPADQTVLPDTALKALDAMRQVAAAARRIAAQMPAVAAAMTTFVDTLRTHLPADAHALPDAITHDGRFQYHVDIWHDLLWYGYVKSADVTASGFTRGGVLRDLRGQIARKHELTDPDTVRLRPVS